MWQGIHLGLPKKMVSLLVIASISAHYMGFRSIHSTIYEGHILAGFAMTLDVSTPSKSCSTTWFQQVMDNITEFSQLVADHETIAELLTYILF
jgi:hypothetical protein